MGEIRPTNRRLRGANGSQIAILGYSFCVVAFLGLQTEFPILICDLSTDAIIGTDTLGSVLPHTLDIKKGLLFTEGGVSFQLHRKDAALSGRMFTVGHCSIPPYSEAVLHCTTRTVGGRPMPPSGLLEGLTIFSENTGLVVGRTLVDPSGWKVPVLVSNFGQETVMVEPLSEIGMIGQVTAIQHGPSVWIAGRAGRPSGTSARAVGTDIRRPGGFTAKPTGPDTPGFYRSISVSRLGFDGHTEAVEHTIDMGDSLPIHCAPRRMSPQKIKQEEACVDEMLTGGQIEPSDSPWSAAVVLVTKKDGGTQFCVGR